MMTAIQKVGASGLTIFVEGKNKGLDMIREHCTDKKVVILAVSFHRAFDIAENYCKRYAPELLDEIREIRSKVLRKLLRTE